MTHREAGRVIRRVYALLESIGEPSVPLHSHVLTGSAGDPYALVQGGYDVAHNRHEDLFVYENGMSLRWDDLSCEEIALHEARHIVQFRRGQELFSFHDALFLRALSVGATDGRVMALLARCRHIQDALESDAVFVTALAYDLEYPVITALTL